MKKKAFFIISFIGAFLLPAFPAFAVDDTASNLISYGQIRLGDINDLINKKYPGKKENFWNVSGIAYHNFSDAPKTDVIIGVAGYRDNGVIYNLGRQMVEDAGAGFAYFHKVKDDWKLIQVELVDGKKYEGFEGSDLTAQGRDQLVVYSSSGITQIANIYIFNNGGSFKKAASIQGFGMGPRVAGESGKHLMVDYQRAMINNEEGFRIYYGRPFRWNGHGFMVAKDEFLDRVQSFDPVHSTNGESLKALEFFEKYLSGHPKDFCAIADCYDLSRRLGLPEKRDQYRKQLAQMKEEPVVCDLCDEWLNDKNHNAQQQYLEWLMGKGRTKKDEN